MKRKTISAVVSDGLAFLGLSMIILPLVLYLIGLYTFYEWEIGSKWDFWRRLKNSWRGNLGK